ncbi:hypothetical protein PFLUV_G00073530 [Perca fluviatilis]|uniref:Uncharacterized protein n=2 Tax=Perca fluviatilis TaxID=8168 RepID=A0A6A5FB41_PERFL|nr:uncharacterized protein si:dkey-283b1.6 isoform X1 [Perca fluviatilis]KAF1389448.1 hypothetical protein PFLUV_G00073530 [Perca fluviatilis]
MGTCSTRFVLCFSDSTSILVHQEFINRALRMPSDYIPILEIFMGIMGFGLSIMFCTTFCRACFRFREDQIEREVWRRTDQEARPPPIFFIPFHGSLSRQDSEDQTRMPHYSQELPTPPQYSNDVYCGPPPSYNELELKPEDLPPVYTEYNVPVYPPSHTDMVHPHTQS